MAAQTRLWRELPYTQATLGTEETRECRSGAILDGRHLRATLPFVAHGNCIGFLDSARPGYRPHSPFSTKWRLLERGNRHNAIFLYSQTCLVYTALHGRALSTAQHG